MKTQYDMVYTISYNNKYITVLTWNLSSSSICSSRQLSCHRTLHLNAIPDCLYSYYTYDVPNLKQHLGLG